MQPVNSPLKTKSLWRWVQKFGGDIEHPEEWDGPEISPTKSYLGESLVYAVHSRVFGYPFDPIFQVLCYSFLDCLSEERKSDKLKAHKPYFPLSKLLYECGAFLHGVYYQVVEMKGWKSLPLMTSSQQICYNQRLNMQPLLITIKNEDMHPSHRMRASGKKPMISFPTVSIDCQCLMCTEQFFSSCSQQKRRVDLDLNSVRA